MVAGWVSWLAISRSVGAHSGHRQWRCLDRTGAMTYGDCPWIASSGMVTSSQPAALRRFGQLPRFGSLDMTVIYRVLTELSIMIILIT